MDKRNCLIKPIDSTVESLIIKFNLENNENHSVDVNAVAKMMLATESLIKEAAKELNFPSEIEVRTCPFEPGSLDINLQILSSFIVAFPGTISTINDIIELGKNYIRLKKFFANNQPKNEDEYNRRIQLISKSENVSNCQNVTFNFYQNCSINNYMADGMTATQSDKQINSIIFKNSESDNDKVEIKRKDFGCFVPSQQENVSSENDLLEEVVDTCLSVKTVDFGKGKWTVIYSGNVIKVSIIDKKFLLDVKNAKQFFTSGVCLVAKLKIVQKYDSISQAYIIDKTKYTIIEVQRVIQPEIPKEIQQLLPLD